MDKQGFANEIKRAQERANMADKQIEIAKAELQHAAQSIDLYRFERAQAVDRLNKLKSLASE